MATRLSQLPPYQHNALREDESRIAHVHPKNHCNDLIVSIEVVKQGCSRLDAVSYAWGRNQRIHRICAGDSIAVRTTEEDGETKTSVNTDVPPSGYLIITGNLRKVLLSIRSEDMFVPLWIDPLSINQDGIAE
ncbi:hypothetical protein QQX98_012751 [Neonectria punicea]|uniref:Heterokaryon incompatibility domain-containing protein n=1 Tax=Neonectria punicea TaxID=979145 RepID=A0ABR1GHY9_9HYPO